AEYLVQRFSFSGSYFLPSDLDTTDDLSLLLEAKLSFSVPIVGQLALETFVDTLWFRGQLPQNNDIGLSLIVGAGFRYDDIFRIPL
ncbi:MAG: hypothetical protein KC561_04585, partial [Myxococcales bacterium]|nr:hypothetical protein [Myxococcales bacterium]